MKGGIRQGGLGSWEIVYDPPHDLDGKRRQVSVALKARNITAAKEERTRLIADRDAGGWTKPARKTTGQFLTALLNDQAAVRVRAKTLKGYESVVRTRLIPHLGGVPLAKLSPAHIGGLFAAMRDNGRLDGRSGQLTPHYISGVYRVLRLALNCALRQGLIRANPIRQIDPPRVPRKEMRALDKSEVRRLLQAAAGT
jgi:integrase